MENIRITTYHFKNGTFFTTLNGDVYMLVSLEWKLINKAFELVI